MYSSAFAFRYFAMQFQSLRFFHSSHFAAFTGDENKLLVRNEKWLCWCYKVCFVWNTFSRKCFKLLKNRLAPSTKALTEKAVWSYLKRVLNKDWDWILNKDLGVHGRRIHHRFLREQSVAHKAFEISSVTECWVCALNTAPGSCSLRVSLRVLLLLLQKSVPGLLGTKRGSSGAEFCKGCVPICAWCTWLGSCMRQQQQPQDVPHPCKVSTWGHSYPIVIIIINNNKSKYLIMLFEPKPVLITTQVFCLGFSCSLLART